MSFQKHLLSVSNTWSVLSHSALYKSVGLWPMGMLEMLRYGLGISSVAAETPKADKQVTQVPSLIFLSNLNILLSKPTFIIAP